MQTKTNHYFWRLLFHGSKFLLRVCVILALWVRDSLKEFIGVFRPLIRSVESQAREAAAAGSFTVGARPMNSFKIGAFLLGTLAVMGKIFLFILSTAPDFDEKKEDEAYTSYSGVDYFGVPDITNTTHSDWEAYYGRRK
ncbi:hypothetical protein [Paracidovorax valerianellae]|uniref:Uncharacterized protein n=1 Tax=Paracidovorax valerianellae TaxID=187868 RepID=A0A1G7ELB2_9BURK|nr:hypothetical protein [Paracidovorax valerianellae]MDA8446394.1 hypothetical protein [Paracidovorax valerianellae]SDE64377.1 hypothetical protein SAMN05192589_12361 [Paracidovorax valerianellae]